VPIGTNLAGLVQHVTFVEAAGRASELVADDQPAISLRSAFTPSK
jgi:hypothetical protein